MVLINVCGLCIAIIVFNIAAYFFFSETKIGQKLSAKFDEDGFLFVNLLCLAIMFVTYIVLGVITTFTFEPAINRSACEYVDVPMAFKDVYYNPEDQSFYVTCANFDALIPVKDLREPNEEESAKIVEYVEENYQHWDELYNGIVKLQNAEDEAVQDGVYTED